jgi:membrane protein implicated in regulation of membrane protease activity
MTIPYLVFIVALLFLLLSALIVAGLARHKKAGARALSLIGATGFIESKLDPEGAVIVDGELWRARLMSDKPGFVAERRLAPSDNGSALLTRNRVRVVGVRAHLLLVEPTSDQL